LRLCGYRAGLGVRKFPCQKSNARFLSRLTQWFSTSVKPRLGKFFFLYDEGPVPGRGPAVEKHWLLPLDSSTTNFILSPPCMNPRLHCWKPEPNRLSNSTASMYNICYGHEEASSLVSEVYRYVIIRKLLYCIFNILTIFIVG
jgi:hypothetical protein